MDKIEIKPNAMQQKCIDNIDGKYLVLAGPGTGKTFTVIQRIKEMILQGKTPEKILCLTFTEAAANEMKVRLEQELNTINTGVNIYTYHGFCYEIIENNAEDFDLPDNFKIISEAISRAFIKECIEQLKPKAFRNSNNDPYPYIDTILKRIEAIKKNRYTKEQYFDNIKQNPDWQPLLNKHKAKLEEKINAGDTRTKTLIKDIEEQEERIAKATELWDFYELYQDKMIKNKYLDFNDMITLVLTKFDSSPSFLEKIANNYEYILVDEYQDTNNSQNAIVFALTKALKSENVFVVGDDDQIIYSFQGARLDTIERFLKEFPQTQVICLNENMRSTQNILDAARGIATQDNSRLEVNPDFAHYQINKNLTAKNSQLIDKNTKVRCYKYADILQEYNEISDEIEQLVNSQNCPTDKHGEKKLSEIAILARTNAELSTFAQLLKDRNIPFELKDGKNIFTIKASIILFYYMQMLTNPELHSDKIFKILLNQPFNINSKDYMKLCEKRSSFKSIIDVIKDIDRNELLEFDKIKTFIQTFEHLQSYKSNETLKNIVLEIGAKTGIFDYYLNSEINRTENIAGLKRIIDEACAFSEASKTIGLEDFVEYLEISLKEDIEILTEKAPVTLNAVQLSTYYSAKGREFEYVYMPTLQARKWELKPELGRYDIPLDLSQYKTEEERKTAKMVDCIKILYVGMTRAKHTLRLSYVQNANNKAQNPTQFITQIQDLFEQESTPFIYDETSFWNQIHKSITKRDYDYKKEFSDLIDLCIKNKSFSPSAINTYLKCPRQYLYSHILDLDTKSGNPNAKSYGSAIHKACEFAVTYAKEYNKYPTKDEMITEFQNKLSKLPVSDFNQREILLQRGQNTLEAYYPSFCATPISMLHQTEMKLKIELDGVKFIGIIDRIDKNPDGTYNIYDYKTGSAKSAKIICPEGEHEDYYNQIALYKYYFEKATGEKVKETTFIYPEEFNKNLNLNLTQEECDNVILKFKSAISSIKQYKFEPTQNKNKSKQPCLYCQYKDFCDLETI